MTVKELIKKLQKIEDQDRIVILQKDPEGNGFYPLSDIDDNSVYDFDNETVHIEKLTPNLIEEGFSEEDLAPDDINTKKALVLFPGY
jgi:hypothetical protein